MINKYNIPIKKQEYKQFLNSIKNNTYRVLCMYEERTEDNEDWKKALNTVIIKITGAQEIFYDRNYLIEILTKLEGLFKKKDVTISVFRKNIFEVLNLIDAEIKLL